MPCPQRSTSDGLAFFVLIMCVVIIAATAACASSITTMRWREWAVERGVARYNPQTGEWEEQPFIPPVQKCH